MNDLVTRFLLFMKVMIVIMNMPNHGFSMLYHFQN